MSRLLASDLKDEEFKRGSVDWRCVPGVTGAKAMTVMDVMLTPGGGHALHRHPDQEEMIIVKSGRIEQSIEHETHALEAGVSVYIDAGEDAHLQVILGPAVGEGEYELVDVSAEEPWVSLR